MKNPPFVFAQPSHQLEVLDGAVDYLETLVALPTPQVLQSAFTEVIDDHDFLTQCHELVDQIGTDEACASGNKRSHHLPRSDQSTKIVGMANRTLSRPSMALIPGRHFRSHGIVLLPESPPSVEPGREISIDDGILVSKH
jgi:hypothetical protein